MSRIDNRVSNLNKDVYDALKQINTKDGISKQEALTIKQAVEKDGKVDTSETDLLDEILTNRKSIDIINQKGSSIEVFDLDIGGELNLNKEVESILKRAKLNPQYNSILSGLEKQGHFKSEVDKKLQALQLVESNKAFIPNAKEIQEFLKEDIAKELQGKPFEEQFKTVEHATKITRGVAQDLCKTFKLEPKIAEKIVDVMKFKDWMQLKGLNAATLGDNLGAQLKLKALANEANEKIVADINKILGTDITASPKQVSRVIDKLLKTGDKIGDLKDIARARLDLPSLDPDEIKAFVNTLVKEYGLDPKTSVKDFLKDLANPDANYKGRMHVSLKTKTGMKFELQIGAEQLTRFYDKEFHLNGIAQNIHDVSYKGVEQYLLTDASDPKEYKKALNAFGHGDPVKGKAVIEETLKILGDGNIEKGKKVLTDLNKLYKANHDKVIQLAMDGKSFDFMELNKEYLKKLSDVYAKIPEKNLPPIYLEAVEKAKLAGQFAQRADDVYETVSKLGLTENKTITKLLNNPKIDNNVMKNILDALNKSANDPKVFKSILTTIETADHATLAKSFAKADAGKTIMEVSKKLMASLSKYGIGEAELIAKVAKGLSKALPVVGGLASGFDTVRLGSIAIAGKDPIFGKEYKDPDVRALALLGANLNLIDTALAVVEITGIGNVDLPVNIALAVGEIGIDIMVDYFNDHPEKMPDEMRIGIRAISVASAAAMPANALTLIGIYGSEIFK